MGATRRFGRPDLGVSAQIHFGRNTFENRNIGDGTLYGFYEFMDGFDLYGGIQQGQVVAGIGIAFVRVAYSFTNQSVLAFFDGLWF